MLAYAALLLATSPASSIQQTTVATGDDASQSTATPVTGSLVAPVTDAAGVVSAGLACFPSGRLRIADFVRSESAFRDAVRDAFSGDPNAPRLNGKATISVALKSIDARLCARGYGVFGMGDRRSMSGESKFAFDWTYQPNEGDLKMGSTQVIIKLKKSEAQPVDAILMLALARLKQQMLSTESLSDR